MSYETGPEATGAPSRRTRQRALIGSAILWAGEVTLYDAALVNSAVRWERHAMLAQRWLRVEKGLTIDQKLAFSREVARASSERDRCLKELKLDINDSRSVIDALYSSTPPTEGNDDDDDASD